MAATATGSADAEDSLLSQRLRFVKYSRDYDVTVQETLYWPALYYSSHQEANKYVDNAEFQSAIMVPVLEMYDYGTADPGPCCRLLGFDDGGFLALGDSDGQDNSNNSNNTNNDQEVLPFYQNHSKLRVIPARKEVFFDKNVEDDEALWACYQASFVEARIILDEAVQKRAGRGKRPCKMVAARLNNKANNKNDKDATKDNDNGNNGGGGGNNDDKGNDKPDASAKVHFQVAAAAVPAASRPTGISVSAAAAAAISTAAPPVLQEVQQNEVESQTAASKETEEAPQEAAAAVAVAVTAASPQRVATKGKGPKSPVTPPFQDKNLQKSKPNKPWSEIWMTMRYQGWLCRKAPTGENYYVKPGRTIDGGVEGVDFFTSEGAVQAYVQSKIPLWRPPVWIADGNSKPAARPPVVNNNHNPMSSSMTVVTTDSHSSSKPAAPTAESSRPSRRAKKDVSYTKTTALTALKEKDRLWWRKESVPKISQVLPILHKLGIRRNENGNWMLPEAVGEDHDSPDLPNVDTLRKFLCTKGVPTVPGEYLLDTEEQELLHKWVSFAYVPVQDLPRDWQDMALPNETHISGMLNKCHFEKSAPDIFPPRVFLSGTICDTRVRGVHVFDGLPQIRDYIRRTATFTWTKDEFEVPNDDVPYPAEESAMLRLWAASSPTPLKTFETSSDEISHMAQILPLAVDSEEEDDSVAAAFDQPDDAEMESSEEEEDEERSTDESQDEDDEDSMEVDSNQVSSASEEESVESVPSESPLRKRKAATKPTTKKNARAKSLPWWQREAFPSWAQMKPIVEKLGIFKDSNGIYVLPPAAPTSTDMQKRTADTHRLDNAESLRRHLCSYGIPKYEKDDPKKPRNLTIDEKEKLRRWVAFAYFPASHDDFVETIEEALPAFNKNFSTENQVANILSRLGFDKDGMTSTGRYPPGIDSLGRDKIVRQPHIMHTGSEIREYIRGAAKLSLDDQVLDDGYLEDRVGRERYLALRLWACLDDSLLRHYPVKHLGTPNSKVSLSPPKVKPATKAVEEVPAGALPEWWGESSEEQLLNRIEELKEKMKNSRRMKDPHMTVESLDVARMTRCKIEAIALATKKSILDVVHKLCRVRFSKQQSEVDVFETELRYFLSGDCGATKMVHAARHKEIAQHLRAWIIEKDANLSDASPSDDPTSQGRDARKARKSTPQSTQSKVSVLENAGECSDSANRSDSDDPTSQGRKARKARKSTPQSTQSKVSVLESAGNGKAKKVPKYEIGLTFQKSFPGYDELFQGTIQEYDEESKLYHILYEDGDEEDLTEGQVTRWIKGTLAIEETQASVEERQYDRFQSGADAKAKTVTVEETPASEQRSQKAPIVDEDDTASFKTAVEEGAPEPEKPVLMEKASETEPSSEAVNLETEVAGENLSRTLFTQEDSTEGKEKENIDPTPEAVNMETEVDGPRTLFTQEDSTEGKEKENINPTPEAVNLSRTLVSGFSPIRMTSNTKDRPEQHHQSEEALVGEDPEEVSGKKDKTMSDSADMGQNDMDEEALVGEDPEKSVAMDDSGEMGQADMDVEEEKEPESFITEIPEAELSDSPDSSASKDSHWNFGKVFKEVIPLTQPGGDEED